MSYYYYLLLLCLVFTIIQGDSVARSPKLFIDNSLEPLATESPCIKQCSSSVFVCRLCTESYKDKHSGKVARARARVYVCMCIRLVFETY